MAWQKSVAASDTNAPRQQVAVYTAVIGLDVETSTLRFTSSLATNEITVAVKSPPEWYLNAWPPQPPGNPDNDLELFALTKLKATFDFAARLPDGSAEEIREQVASRFPGTVTENVTTVSYKRYPVEAIIWEDGTVTWSYDIPAAGDFPESIQDSGDDADLDIFVRNLVRYDLQRQIESIYTNP